MDFYLIDKSNKLLRFPMNPEGIEVRNAAKLENINIIQLGDVKIPRGNMCSSLSWEGILPGEAKKNMPYVKKWQKPSEIVRILSVYRHQGEKLRLLVTETPLCYDVYIESFEHNWQGGFGDVQYRISLVEAKDLSIYSDSEYQNKGLSGTNKDTSRSFPPSPKVYKVRSGDTLYAIAKRYLGNGNRYKEIYDLNRSVIGSDCNLIKPGQALKIPGGEVD